MSRHLITFIALFALASLGSTQMGGCGSSGGGDTGGDSYTVYDNTLDLMVENHDSSYYWMEIGWSAEGEGNKILDQSELGWISPSYPNFGLVFLFHPGPFFLLLYDTQDGELLDTSPPFYRAEGDVVFVDASISGGTMTIDVE